MAIKLVALKNKAGDVYYPATAATQVIRGASTVDADLAAVETLAGAAIPGAQKGAASGVATLGVDGKVPTSQLPSQALTVADQNVADITALTALSAAAAPVGANVFVGDASGDETVGSGWAVYRRIATAGGTLGDWAKIAEGEGLDVAMVDQTARDAADAAQDDVDALETQVGGLGTVFVLNTGADASAVGDNDLIVEITGTV
jgi:hypothetical protein